jgi:hypothetical protein
VRKPPPVQPRSHPRKAAEPGTPLSDADRLFRGLPLESGEAQPLPMPPRTH